MNLSAFTYVVRKNLEKLGVPYVNFKYHNTNSTVQNLSD